MGGRLTAYAVPAPPAPPTVPGSVTTPVTIPVTIPVPGVTVLVGAPGSGKTTLRRRATAAGLDPALVVSLDDLRRELRQRRNEAGREPRPLQAESYPAVLRARERENALLANRLGYLVDSTNLRRRERVSHVRQARAAGLPVVALLLPDVPLDELLRRNEERPADDRVPPDVLAKHAHRRSLVSAATLLEEGFDDARDIVPAARVHVLRTG